MKRISNPERQQHHVLKKQEPFLRKATFLGHSDVDVVVEYVRQVVKSFRSDEILLKSIHKKCTKYIESVVNACLLVMYDNGEIEIVRILKRTSYVDGIKRTGL